MAIFHVFPKDTGAILLSKNSGIFSALGVLHYPQIVA